MYKGEDHMDVVRIGIIGVGGMGTGHARNLPKVQEVKLTAVADVDPTALKTATDAFDVPGFPTSTALIHSGLVDAVLIATPHYFHAPIAIEAMRAGLHVYCEKPMAVQASEADKMIQVAKETGKTLAIGFQMHTDPELQAAYKLVAEGKLGEIYRTLLVEGRFRSQAYYDSASWRATWKGEGGGVLMNQAPHFMDVFIWLGGLPKRVWAKCNTRQHDIEVEDEAMAMLEYANGAVGLFHESVNELPTSSRLELLGEYGKIVLDDGKLRFWEVPAGVKGFTRGAKNMWDKVQAREVEVEVGTGEGGQADLVRNMARHIMHGEPLLTPAEACLGQVELTNAIMLSSETGQPVDIPVDRAAFDALIQRKIAESKFTKSVSDASKRVTDPNLR